MLDSSPCDWLFFFPYASDFYWIIWDRLSRKLNLKKWKHSDSYNSNSINHMTLLMDTDFFIFISTLIHQTQTTMLIPAFQPYKAWSAMQA